MYNPTDQVYCVMMLLSPNEELKGELMPSEKNNLANGVSRRMIKSNVRIRIKDF